MTKSNPQRVVMVKEVSPIGMTGIYVNGTLCYQVNYGSVARFVTIDLLKALGVKYKEVCCQPDWFNIQVGFPRNLKDVVFQKKRKRLPLQK